MCPAHGPRLGPAHGIFVNIFLKIYEKSVSIDAGGAREPKKLVKNNKKQLEQSKMHKYLRNRKTRFSRYIQTPDQPCEGRLISKLPEHCVFQLGNVYFRNRGRLLTSWLLHYGCRALRGLFVPPNYSFYTRPCLLDVSPNLACKILHGKVFICTYLNCISQRHL